MKKYFSFLFLILSLPLLADQSYTVDLSEQHVKLVKNTGDLDVSMGQGVYYNSYYGGSWVMHNPGVSYLEVMFSRGEDERGCAKLTLNHLSSLVGNKYFSPVTLSVNGKTVASHFAPASFNYITDTFDLSGYLVNGENRLRISFDAGAIGNYWIKSLKVDIAD